MGDVANCFETGGDRQVVWEDFSENVVVREIRVSKWKVLGGGLVLEKRLG